MAHVLVVLMTLVLLAGAASAQEEKNCNTGLTRIGKRAAEKAISDHRGDACAGLKKGSIGIDKTKALDLKEFSLCETGPVVSASMTVHVWCATSDKAFLPADISGDVTATASANLDTCEVLDADISSSAFVVDTGLRVADLKKKLREAAEKEIKSYCK